MRDLTQLWRAAFLSLVVVADSPATDSPATDSPATGAQNEKPAPVFREVSRAAGIDVRHRHGGCGRRSFVEQVGGGVVLADFDADGWLDVVLMSGAPLASCPPEEAPTLRFFRGAPELRFTDATGAAGLERSRFYAIGGAAADYDGDGDLDLYVTCYGPNRLFRNDGARFGDVAVAAGVADPSFSTSATFFDYDGDGDLDLYVANYVRYAVAADGPCERSGVPVYCLPQDFQAAPDRLFRNRGDGSFDDVTRESGVFAARGRGLGVAAADYDGDGDLDLYVANDATDNLLFENRGDGTFAERGLAAGVALSEDGSMENGMGTHWGDIDSDGRFDLIVTNFEGETNSLYRNVDGEFFIDVSYASGVGRSSYPLLGWAAIFGDYDLDGALDLFVTNGHVFDNVGEFEDGGRAEQPNLLCLGDGRGQFRTVEPPATSALALRRNSRGAAAGDLDNDGDLDLVVSNWDARCDVLQNETSSASARHYWLGISCVRSVRGRSAIGSVVVVTSGGDRMWRQVENASGYLSQSDSRLLFGLGARARVDAVDVLWPGGARERFSVDGVNRYVRLAEGEGTRLNRGAPEEKNR